MDIRNPEVIPPGLLCSILIRRAAGIKQLLISGRYLPGTFYVQISVSKNTVWGKFLIGVSDKHSGIIDQDNPNDQGRDAND